jgi:hypothetical protein
MPIDGSGLCMIIELGYFVNVHRVEGSCWVCVALSFKKKVALITKTFLIMRCLDVKEYQLRCHKYNFVAHSNQKHFRLLLLNGWIKHEKKLKNTNQTLLE